jgi:hypothetical protein
MFVKNQFIRALPAMAVGLFATALPALAGPVLQNGSFAATSGITTTGSGFSISNDGTLTGWSANTSVNQITCLVYSGAANNNLCGMNVFGGGLSIDTPGITGVIPASPDGGNFILSDGDKAYASAVSTTVTGLVGGGSYTISFYQAGSWQTGYVAGTNTSENWNVTLGGQTLSSTVMNTPVGSFYGWNKQSLTFTLPSNAVASQVLSFLAVGPSGYPPMVLLDGVSITQNVSGSSVPEPALGLLIGVGLLAIPLVGKRLRKKG